MLVRSGDVIAAMDIGQSFTVMGATGRPRRVNFATEVVTLDQALGQAGGLADNRADPSSVFVFRYEDREAAVALAGPSAVKDPDAPLAPMVYQLDLSDPGSFFLARRFAVEDGDIIYAANADLAQAAKILQVVSRTLSPTAQTLRLINNLD